MSRVVSHIDRYIYMQFVCSHINSEPKPSPWSHDRLQQLTVRIRHCCAIILLEAMRPSVLRTNKYDSVHHLYIRPNSRCCCCRTCLCYSCHKLLRLPGGCFLFRFGCAPVCLFLPLVSSLARSECGGFVCFACFGLLSATCPSGGHHTFLGFFSIIRARLNERPFSG